MGYSTFTVTSPGVFTIFTTGTTVDPVLYLFTGTSDALGAALERDDDACAGVPGLCGPSGGHWNAIIDGRALTEGTYTVAVGDYDLSEAEARGARAWSSTPRRRSCWSSCSFRRPFSLEQRQEEQD